MRFVTTDSQNAIERSLDRWLKALETGTRVWVAYSGGIDSSVLLHALAQRQSDALCAIHIHHGLSPNADAWAAHCEATCKSLGIPLTVVRVTVEDCKKLGVEAAAREARYAALRSHTEANNATIALAHHARDQAETVLLQLLRGAGPAGLAAMPEHAPPFARPLLQVSKNAIDAYAAEHSISHINDESNADARFARNRLRNQVWPTLIEHFATAETTLVRAATWQHEADQLATSLADIDLRECTKSDDNGALLWSKWRALTPPRRRNVLRHWLAKNKLATPSSDRLLEWERQLLSENATQNVTLTHASFEGSIRRYRDHIQFVRRSAVSSEQMKPGVIWSGEREVAFGTGRVCFALKNTSKLDNDTVLLRPIQSGESWRIRLRRERDLIYLSPNSGGVTLKNVFQQHNIAPWLRSEWPVLTCNGEIAAIPGLAIAHHFVVGNDAAGYALAFRFE
jgi:tRNA(Ile)-lysidine synthase